MRDLDAVIYDLDRVVGGHGAEHAGKADAVPVLACLWWLYGNRWRLVNHGWIAGVKVRERMWKAGHMCIMACFK